MLTLVERDIPIHTYIYERLLVDRCTIIILTVIYVCLPDEHFPSYTIVHNDNEVGKVCSPLKTLSQVNNTQFCI